MPTKKEKREAEEKENTREGCFGTFSDDDENCEDCDDLEGCTERTKEIEDGLSEDTDDEGDEVEEPEEEADESDSKDFDPASVDLSDSATRIDTLADLSAGDLLSLAEHHKVKIPDDAKKDESEMMILIDDHFDNLPDEEPEEKEDPEPKKKDKEPEPESDPDSDEDDESEEEEPKPKPRQRRKKKPEPEPVIEEDFVDLDEDDVEKSDTDRLAKIARDEEDRYLSDKPLEVASDVITETLEILLDRFAMYLTKYGDIDHLKGLRGKLDSVIEERAKAIEPEEEVEYPEHPDYFADIANANGAKIFDKGDTVSMKIGPTVLAKLVLHKDKWQVLYSQGKLDKLPGTRSYKAHKGYPAIAAAHAKASRLLDFHVKTRKRGMRRK